MMVKFSGDYREFMCFNFPKSQKEKLIFKLFNRYLSSNRVTSMEPGYFDSLANTLLVLKLNRNRLSAIPPKMFKLPQLQHL